MRKNRPIFVGLLRGINVLGANRIAMAELCALCSKIGWRDVRSYIQSGNLVFSASAPPEILEAELETALRRRLKLSVSVIVRTSASWVKYVRNNPFPELSKNEPHRVLLALPKLIPKRGAVEELRECAAGGESVMQTGDAVWIHYASGVGKSKLSSALLDRLVGSPVTARNWRTVQKLAEMARQGAES